MRREVAKRVLDVSGAVIGLVVLAPIMAVVALAVLAGLGPPVLFRQVRPGRHGRPFVIYKFRTMRDLRDAEGNLLSGEARLTRLGAFLRVTSIDELPELINVLTGDMSLVGPRPLLWHYLPRYSPEQARRHDLKPGITGWAQVNGRNAIDWEQRFAFDVWYVDHYSLWLDLRILARTVLNVLIRAGVSPAGRDLNDEFRGSPRAPQRPEAVL